MHPRIWSNCPWNSHSGVQHLSQFGQSWTSSLVRSPALHRQSHAPHPKHEPSEEDTISHQGVNNLEDIHPLGEGRLTISSEPDPELVRVAAAALEPLFSSETLLALPWLGSMWTSVQIRFTSTQNATVLTVFVSLLCW